MKTHLLALLGGIVCLTGFTSTASADTTNPAAERVSHPTHYYYYHGHRYGHRRWVVGSYHYRGGHRYWVRPHYRYW